ncbi:MAG TPA: hypothetical protein VMT46_15570 [Anaerolineaceae bacterium]|nr:hypothetical protein [Anaerolineaceae bacterium]
MFKKMLVIAVFALIGWGICGAIINIGRKTIGVDATLIVHAIAVPIVFSILSFFYHRFFHYTRPLYTALIFTGLAILLDAGIIAPLAEKSYVMFTSILGTWIPFGLILISTYVVGSLTSRAAGSQERIPA